MKSDSMFSKEFLDIFRKDIEEITELSTSYLEGKSNQACSFVLDKYLDT